MMRGKSYEKIPNNEGLNYGQTYHHSGEENHYNYDMYTDMDGAADPRPIVPNSDVMLGRLLQAQQPMQQEAMDNNYANMNMNVDMNMPPFNPGNPNYYNNGPNQNMQQPQYDPNLNNYPIPFASEKTPRHHNNFNINNDNDNPEQNFYNDVLGSLNHAFNLNGSHQVSGASDVGVDSFMAAFGFNSILFVFLILSYEIFSRMIPSVYQGRNLHVTHDRKALSLDSSKSLWRCLPLSWVPTVVRTSWTTVKSCGGLDAYFFLRYIRMCLRITVVAGLWGILVLWPVFSTGGDGASGWYHFSMANVKQGNWRVWFPAIFMWFLSFYVFFVMNEEYKHYLELRMQFLAEGDVDINPQINHSLIVEEIPHELRSDYALYTYFDNLFPGKIHSASVVLNIPDLEKLAEKRKRAVRRLEKSIAYYEATGTRMTHVVGRKRFRCCGIETFPVIPYGGKKSKPKDDEDDDSVSAFNPQRGERVDSINYYTTELNKLNEKMLNLQEIKKSMAEQGNDSVSATQWISNMINLASDVAANRLNVGMSDNNGLLVGFPKSSQFCNFLRVVGVDFLFGGFTFLDRNIDVVVDTISGSTMSSTGFVTFNDLATIACATRAPLSHDPDVLMANIAPDPRDVQWENAHISISYSKGREYTANFFLGLGAILWSIPVASIQALATIDHIAEIPGMMWMNRFNGGQFSSFVNGYLPVVCLLIIILILPIIFEWIAINFEDRKTKSNVQRSILGRFFYYQLANIYITVTAGSLWVAMGKILDHPGNALAILGKSVPTVVGYFVTFLMTKTLSGLPILMLRPIPLLRMIILRILFRTKLLTQRELDEIYKKETLSGGAEYPNQLLIIIICFTLACISPIILPVGAIYFSGALVVYKKQVLLVYTPDYESGGTMFPAVCHRTLIGLICGQVTLIGYTIIRAGFYQPLMLLPLPFITYKMMRSFERRFEAPGAQLSLERAIELDKGSMVKIQFNEDLFRQPVLAEGEAKPQPYRLSPDTSPSTSQSHRHQLGVLHRDSNKIV